MMKSVKIFPVICVVALMGCSRSEGWHLSGVAPADVETVYLQAPTNTGGWYVVDSAEVKGGKYIFDEARANGTIYAVKAGEATFYVPADSTETIELTADGVRAGSEEALLFNRVDSVCSASGDSRAMLRALDGRYSSVAAYYATRLMNDYRLLRTVANRYVEERPDDPCTAVLRAELAKVMPRSEKPAEQQVIFAEEISYYDVELMDRDGKMHKLSETVAANPLVVLAYVDFTADSAPAVTRALGDARASGAEIYEVGFSENQHLWAIASEGLPWVNVYQSDAADRTHISQYAVSSFPTFFIIKSGEIVERVNDYGKLAETVKKHK